MKREIAATAPALLEGYKPRIPKGFNLLISFFIIVQLNIIIWVTFKHQVTSHANRKAASLSRWKSSYSTSSTSTSATSSPGYRSFHHPCREGALHFHSWGGASKESGNTDNEAGIDIHALLQYLSWVDLDGTANPLVHVNRTSWTFPNVLYIFGGCGAVQCTTSRTDVGSTLDSNPIIEEQERGVWVSKKLYSKQHRVIVKKDRAPSFHQLLQDAWAILQLLNTNEDKEVESWILFNVNDTRTKTQYKERWQRVLRASTDQEVGIGVPFLMNYEDYTYCGYQNFRPLDPDIAGFSTLKKERVVYWKKMAVEGVVRLMNNLPVFSLCGSSGCNHEFPVPTYSSILAAKTSPKEWEVEHKKDDVDFPWANKTNEVLWRGSLTGHLRKRVSNKIEEMLDHAKLSDGKNESFVSRLNFKVVSNRPKSRHINRIPLRQQQAFKAILDMDGNAWSERFAKLLCLNSAILKVDTSHRDYFAPATVKPFHHFIPVNANLSNLEEMVEFALSPEKEKEVKEIVKNAREWCRARIVRQQLVFDMLDILENYVAELDSFASKEKNRISSSWERVWQTSFRSSQTKMALSKNHETDFVSSYWRSTASHGEDDIDLVLIEKI